MTRKIEPPEFYNCREYWKGRETAEKGLTEISKLSKTQRSMAIRECEIVLNQLDVLVLSEDTTLAAELIGQYIEKGKSEAVRSSKIKKNIGYVHTGFARAYEEVFFSRGMSESDRHYSRRDWATDRKGLFDFRVMLLATNQGKDPKEFLEIYELLRATEKSHVFA